MNLIPSVDPWPVGNGLVYCFLWVTERCGLWASLPRSYFMQSTGVLVFSTPTCEICVAELKMWASSSVTKDQRLWTLKPMPSVPCVIAFGPLCGSALEFCLLRYKILCSSSRVLSLHLAWKWDSESVCSLNEQWPEAFLPISMSMPILGCVAIYTSWLRGTEVGQMRENNQQIHKLYLGLGCSLFSPEVLCAGEPHMKRVRSLNQTFRHLWPNIEPCDSCILEVFPKSRSNTAFFL